jgi:eukaryotic-like serine/threonine-protein kinase
LLTAGTKLGHYEITAPLGAGGMGEVYLAHDARLNRDVAIKVLPADRSMDDAARQRFLREARAASALNHPNIITIYETDSHDGVAYIAMEYVRGRTLASLVEAGRLPDSEVVGYAIQIADALAKAHAAGIVHRDLKPGNIMITEDGLVKVLDFGLAKVGHVTKHATAGGPPSSAETLSLLSMPGSTVGTLSYMSPEQARGEAVDARSDIFSFGTVLFQMFTLELPFAGDNLLAILHNLHFGAPKDIRYLRPDLAPPIAAIVGKCLRKEPQDRYQSAAELGRDLRATQGQASSVIAATTSGTIGASERKSSGELPSAIVEPGSKRRKWRATLAVAVLALIAASVTIPSVRRRLSESLHSMSGRPAANGSVQTVPDTPFALQRQAQTFLERWDVPDNLDRSITLLNRAIELDHNFAPAYASLTFAYFEKNRINADPQWAKQATQSATRALQLNSDLADAHLSGGVAAMLAGKNSESEREFRKAAELDPKSSKPHRWMGFLFNSIGNSKAAEAELARALALDANDWRARMNLGLLYYKTARYSEAATAWEQVSKLTPDNFIILNNLAAVYHMLDRYEDAATVLQRSLEIKPDAYTYGNLGTLRFFQGRYEDAVPAFEKAVKLEANEYLWWGNLGDGYRWAPGQAAKAKPAYENALRLARERLAAHAGDFDAQLHVALYLAKIGDDKKSALAEIAKVDGVKQKEAGVFFTSAIVHELCGERDVALAMLSAAVKQGYALKEIKNEPELVALRTDPRYQSILTQMPAK